MPDAISPIKEVTPARLFGLIGYPLSHSFSASYFKAKFEKERIAGSSYQLFPIPVINDLPALIGAHPNLYGLNVTIPYKREVLSYLHSREGIPAGLEACNCIEIRDKKLYGYNTDVSGFITGHREPPPLPVETDTVKLGDVLFDFNKAALKPQALNILSAYFLNNPTGKNIDSVYIEGHTDSIGSDKRNLELSLQRCQSIQSWLTRNNIVSLPGTFIHPYGRTRPVATNKTAAGRSLNRRVEIIIFRRKK